MVVLHCRYQNALRRAACDVAPAIELPLAHHTACLRGTGHPDGPAQQKPQARDCDRSPRRERTHHRLTHCVPLPSRIASPRPGQDLSH